MTNEIAKTAPVLVLIGHWHRRRHPAGLDEFLGCQNIGQGLGDAK